MVNLSNDNKQKTDPREWITRLGIPAAIGFGIYLILPFLTDFAMKIQEFAKAAVGATLWMVILGVLALVVGLPVLYAITNPMVVWMKYRSWCRKVTAGIVKMDPISFMESYIELLKKKMKNLVRIIQDLIANRISLQREVESLKKSAKEKMTLAQAAKKMGEEDEAAHQAGMAQQDIESVNLYTPMLERFNTNINYLEKLKTNWNRNIEKLSFTVERKKREWEMLNKMAKAFGMAEEFASGESEASQLYFASVKALEEKVSNSMAYIEEFEKNAAGKMKTIDLEKAVMDEEGMSALEQYMQSGKLFIDEDYSKFDISQKVQAGGKNMFAKGSANRTTFQSNFNSGSNNQSGQSEFDHLLK